MVTAINSANPGLGGNVNVTTPTGTGFLARGGATIASQQALIDADLATMTAAGNIWIRSIIVNFGANDVSSLPAEATWKANLDYVLDALHVKYPNASVYVTRPWRRGFAAECNTLATWIAAELVARSTWAFVGDDERVWLEGGDDGATMSVDGIHYSTAGQAVAASQRKTAIGY
jgi:lysophospholipase L1-like esterase